MAKGGRWNERRLQFLQLCLDLLQLGLCVAPRDQTIRHQIREFAATLTKLLRPFNSFWLVRRRGEETNSIREFEALNDDTSEEAVHGLLWDRGGTSTGGL